VFKCNLYRYSVTSNMTKAEIRDIPDPVELVAAAVKKSTLALDALGGAVYKLNAAADP
jgi:hypothetical protein